MYAANVDGRRLTFEVAGLWRRNMMMRDRETGSIWQQATGEAVAGPLKGRRLDPVGGSLVTWSAWKTDYPDTDAVTEPPGAGKGIIGLLPYQAMVDIWGRLPFTLPGLSPSDPRLPSREELAGLTLSGEARAYPLAVLRRVGVVNDRLGGIPVAVIYEPRGDRVRAFKRPTDQVELLVQDGSIADATSRLRWRRDGSPASPNAQRLEPIPISRQWWMAWSEFHPETSLYETHS